MTREQFERANEIDREIMTLSAIIDDAKNAYGVAWLFTYHVIEKDETFNVPMSLTKDIIEVIKRHKEQLQKEFEEL